MPQAKTKTLSVIEILTFPDGAVRLVLKDGSYMDIHRRENSSFANHGESHPMLEWHRSLDHLGIHQLDLAEHPGKGKSYAF